MEIFRPEYVEALDAARWNAWWLLALVVPFILAVGPVLDKRGEKHATCAQWVDQHQQNNSQTAKAPEQCLGVW